MSSSEVSPNSQRDGWLRFFLASAIVSAAITAVYFGSIRAPFVFDDITAIPENRSIRTLWAIDALTPPAAATTMAGRPLANLSLALNYAISGVDPWSYHVFNMVVHIGGTLALFGVVRRSLLLPKLSMRFGADSWMLAFSS